MKKRVVIGGVVSAFALSLVAVVGMNDSIVSKASVNNNQTVQNKISKVDIALVENQAEEKYIVGLVSARTNQDLDTSDWEVCLKYLEDNYEELIADESLDSEKIESYVTDYSLIKKSNEEEATGAVAEQEETGVNAAIANNTYDVSKVTKYINKYWETHNPNFPSYEEYGGDCANFVSQCLYAGGMKMTGTNTSSFNSWFCRTSRTEQVNKVSSTWRGAAAFAEYWKKNCMEYRDFDLSYFEDRQAFNEIYRFANVGDAMSFINENGRPYHTTIVSLKNRDGDRDIRFAAHTSPHCDESLYEYIEYSWVDKVRVYRMSTPDPELEASYDYDMKNVTVDIVDSLENEEEVRRGFWSRLFFRNNR